MVNTANGTMRGLVGGGLAAFKGVRYGESTAGSNRFLPPVPVQSWKGVRDAMELGNPCVQTNPDFPIWLDPMDGSEDCLFLNVWSPEDALPKGKLPVMVWIHGGGYTFGSGGAPMYDCGKVAVAGNVVCISLNHRLQAFGFTDLSELGDQRFAGSGNAGLLDIVEALRWVKSNVEEFGGDSDNVTLFGQSGGGAKITALMAMPAASGLFHKAIVQSGSVFRFRGSAEAEATSRRTFDLLGLSSTDVLALQKVPANVLLKCGDRIMEEATGTGHPALKYAPVVDGWTIPSDPLGTSPPHISPRIPLIVGSNLDETVVFMEKEPCDDASIAAAVVHAATVYTPDIARIAEVIPVYRRALPDASSFELAVRISTDIGFWKNAVRHAEVHSSAGGTTFMYRCDWKTPCCNGKWAPHSVELPFVLGHKRYGTAWDGNDNEVKRDEADPKQSRFNLGDKMLSAWLTFARSGNPSLPDLHWPRYDLEKRSTMLFDSETVVSNDPAGHFRKLVSQI
ncbi:carboxylesterase [Rhizobium leguminosarum bv. trifolii]|nr:carboxylesterase [Rhizobium leguminosarum bv. trifolii]